jgi:hypothetical protein
LGIIRIITSMPTLINAYCYYCGKIFQVSLKRYNESNKKNWKFYCSLACQGKNKNRTVELICSNPSCKNIFKRLLSEVGKYGNYCSNSCAAKVSNKLRRGSYVYKTNKINSENKSTTKKPIPTNKIIRINEIKLCGNPLCSKIISGNKNFCSNICQGETLKKSNETYRQEVIETIKTFVLVHNRIPTKKEVSSTYKKAAKGFGSWNKAIKAAGFKPNPVMFAYKHYANDGHLCDSFAEMIIDNWLTSNQIEHKIHIPYPENHKLKADFIVGDIWIEYFGLHGEVRKYDKLVKQKLKLIKKHRINLIQIYPKDLFPKNKLDEVLAPLVKNRTSDKLREITKQILYEKGISLSQT